MKPLRIAVVGTVASDPYAGMAWMTMQVVAGLRRLGHDAWYFEVTSRWPYDPCVQQKVRNADHALPYLARVAEYFDLRDYWAYRRTYDDGAWLGPSPHTSAQFLASADLVFNVAGATSFAEDSIAAGPLVYYGTDPVFPEVKYAAGDPVVRALIDEHAWCVTFGENIGNPDCPIPPLPRLRARTRQPVLLDRWSTDQPPRAAFTTVGNWKQDGRDIMFGGETYFWSKHREFAKFLSLPSRTARPIELATNLMPSRDIVHSDLEEVTAGGLAEGEYEMLTGKGWHLLDGPAISKDPATYRDYVVTSRGEFTVARDLNVRLKSGWFSERSACYLAAGRPVVTQDTGFGSSLPVGDGLFAVSTLDEAVAAIEAIDADYAHHSNAAREIAQRCFRAETVLSDLLGALG
jgi:hypothetical protein